jgi:hypothetical protein
VISYGTDNDVTRNSISGKIENALEKLRRTVNKKMGSV